MKGTYEAIDMVLRRSGVPSYVPLYEHGFDDGVAAKIMGWQPLEVDWKSFDSKLAMWKRRIEFYRQMGFGYLPMELPPRFAPIVRIAAKDFAGDGQRMWANEHSGSIQTWADLENPDYWPTPENAFDYRMFETVSAQMPEGMKVIGGVSGAVFEYATALGGLTDVCIKTVDDPAFVNRLFDRIGTTFIGITGRLLNMPNFGALRMGDDLGFKNGTFFSPAQLRKYVFPWHRQMAKMAHDAGVPYALHSCGNIELVMEDLIEDVGIDARHSFEDVILPVTEAKRKWGRRIALLGGLDVDFLGRKTPSEIEEYAKRTLEICAVGGGYAMGSGNSIASYIPPENFLAIKRATDAFNGN